MIVHVCNDAGGWGRGFVLALSARWREPEAAYRQWAAGTASAFGLGEVQFVPVGPDLWVANMVAQKGTGPRRRIPPIRYEALRTALRKVSSFCQEHDAAAHMPRIGCGLAGGEWTAVSAILAEELSSRGVPVTVYDFPPASAAS